VVALERELPDFLPVMLEFAVADPDRGLPLLQRFRASLELLRIGLAEDRLPHAGVLTAICDSLPGESPKTRLEVQAMVDEVAPLEMVGLSSTNVTWLPRS
jgi:nitrate reductase delta subunit